MGMLTDYLIWKEDGSLLKLGPVFSFTVKFIIMHIFSVYNNTVNSLCYASSFKFLNSSVLYQIARTQNHAKPKFCCYRYYT